MGNILSYTPLGLYGRAITSIGKRRAKKVSSPDYSDIYAEAHDRLKGTRQDDLVDSVTVADYKPSFLDYAEMALTGNKSRRWLNAEMQNEQYLRDRMAELSSTMSEEERNSPAVQSALMRSAGLNPDLLGVSDSSGQASEMSEPDVMQSGAGGLTDSQPNFLSQFAGIAGNVLSIISGLQNVRSVQLMNRNQEIKNLSDIAGAADAFFEGSLTPPVVEALMTTDEHPDYEAWERLGSEADFKQAVEKYGEGKVRYGRPSLLMPDLHFRNKKDKELFEAHMWHKYNSLSTDADFWAKYAERMKNRKSALVERSFKGYSDEDNNYSEALSGLADLSFEYEKNYFEFESKLAAYNARVTELRNAGDEAGAINARNEMEKFASLTESQFNEMFWDEAQKIRKRYPKNSAMYYSAMLGLSQSMMIYHDNIMKTLAEFGLEAYGAKTGRVAADNAGKRMSSQTVFDKNGEIIGGREYQYH